MHRNGPDEAEWVELVRTHRREKQETFASESESPLSSRALERFSGLKYYDIVPDLRIEGRFEPAQEVDEVTLETSQGPPMSFDHVGHVGFELAGEFVLLCVYRVPGVSAFLVPFRDETNGSETWTNGRYLNVSIPDGLDTPSKSNGPESDRSKQYTVTLDFNLAYHPLCVYDETVRSATPPESNAIPTGVRAGERL